MNLTAEREAHLRHLAGTDNAMRDAIGMLDRSRRAADWWLDCYQDSYQAARLLEDHAARLRDERDALRARLLNNDARGADSARPDAQGAGANAHADAQAVARADEPHGIEPRAAADAPQRLDAGSGLGDLAAGRANVGDGLGGEGGHGKDGST